MKYFVAWSYAGESIHSHVYDFKYYINDVDDYNYLKMEIASSHTVTSTGKSPDPNNIHILNFILLSDKEQQITGEQYVYSIAYVDTSGEIDKFFDMQMTFNTPIQTISNLKDVFNRLEEETGHKRNDLSIINYTLLETIEEGKTGSTE